MWEAETAVPSFRPFLFFCSGCTVHFVEVEVDAGAIVLQRAVNVELNDTEDTLSERIKVGS